MTVRTRTATVLSHARPAQTAEALRALIEAAEREGVLLRFDAEETRKYGLTPREGLVLDAPLSDDVELCVSLGGDGTILRALRRYAGTSVPVFAVNYGEVGFLATIDPDEDGDLLGAFERALAGDFEVLTLPALALETPEGPQAAINDVAIHRRAGERVAELAYAIDGEEAGSVRCDGLVLSTPAGLDGLQPRQRRPGAGLGRGGLRGVVHRAALADRAGAGGRPERPAVGPQPLAGRGRHLARRAPGRPARPGRRHQRVVPARGGRSGAGPRARRSTGACARSSGAWRRADAHASASKVRRERAKAAGPSAAAGTSSDVLLELRVENLLLIERAELRLAPGLNVLTGETGAGKTVLAHALDLLLGGRARAGIVRPGAAEAYVEGVFELPAALRGELGERLPADAEEVVLARRVSAEGRTRAYLCGRSAAVGDLREVAVALLSFYGQHEHRKLTLASAQLEILDGFCGAAHLARRAEFAATYARVRELEATLAELRERAGARERELDLLAFELQEIEAADPSEAEAAELRGARERLRHLEALRAAALGAAQAAAPDEGTGVTGLLAAGGAGLDGVSGVDPGLDALAERWRSLAYEADDLAGELLRYAEGLEGEPGRAGGHRGAPGRARAPGAQARRHDRRRPGPRRALPRAARRAGRRRGRARARSGRARGGARRAGAGGRGAAGGAREGGAAAGRARSASAWPSWPWRARASRSRCRSASRGPPGPTPSSSSSRPTRASPPARCARSPRAASSRA